MLHSFSCSDYDRFQFSSLSPDDQVKKNQDEGKTRIDKHRNIQLSLDKQLETIMAAAEKVEETPTTPVTPVTPITPKSPITPKTPPYSIEGRKSS